MALTEESRSKFAKSAAEFVRKYKLDGIDIDWEYPGLPGIGNTHRPEDKKLYVALKSSKRRTDKYEAEDNKHYSTTVAGAADEFVEATEMGEVARYLDFVNLMTYDFYVAEADLITGHHTCLYTNPDAPKDIQRTTPSRIWSELVCHQIKLSLVRPFMARPGEKWIAKIMVFFSLASQPRLILRINQSGRN